MAPAPTSHLLSLSPFLWGQLDVCVTLSEGEERTERGRLQGLGPSQAFDITSFACVGLS